MRTPRTLIGLVALLAAALAPSAPQKGPEPGDIDRKVDPCTDFYEFANGAWRAGNPIPASMPRWSRRWAAGEASKDRLKADPRRGVRGEGPAQRERRAVDRRLLRRLHGRGPGEPPRRQAARTALHGDRRHQKPGGGAGGDLAPARDRGARPVRVLRQFGQPQPDGRDRPDRRERPRHAGPRLLPQARAALQGSPGEVRRPRRRDLPPGRRERGHGEGRGGHRHAHGNEARRKLPGQRRAAGPQGDRPQDLVCRPPEDDARFQLDGLLPSRLPRARVPARGAGEHRRRQRRRAEVPRRVQPPADRLSDRRLEDVSQVAAPGLRRAVPVRRLRPGGLRLQRRLPLRRQGDEAALEALRRIDRPPPRRGARQEVRREVLPARGQGPDAGAGQEPPDRDGRDDPGARLDEPGDEAEARSRSCRRSIRRSVIRTSGRTTARSRSPARRTGTTSSRDAGSTCRTTWRRSASPSIAGAGA